MSSTCLSISMSDETIDVSVNEQELSVNIIDEAITITSVEEVMNVSVGVDVLSPTATDTTLNLTESAESISVGLQEQALLIDIDQVVLNILEEEEVNYDQKFDETTEAGNKVIYIGQTAVGNGSNTAGAVWRIKKFVDYTGQPDCFTWADGVDTFTKVWDDRATYTY